MKLGTQFRFNNKCKQCGTKFSVLATTVMAPKPHYFAYETEDGQTFYPDPSGSNDLVYECSGCGAKRKAKMVLGKYNPRKECNAKCQAATGHQCECSCGGKNHGATNEG